MGATVRVMNSHDYSHFEVVLSTEGEISPREVNEMRKVAQRLVDNAIRQYKVAKEKASAKLNSRWERESMVDRAAEIRLRKESERTPEEQALLKAVDDDDWGARFRYDYDDDDDLDF